MHFSDFTLRNSREERIVFIHPISLSVKTWKAFCLKLKIHWNLHFELSHEFSFYSTHLYLIYLINGYQRKDFN